VLGLPRAYPRNLKFSLASPLAWRRSLLNGTPHAAAYFFASLKKAPKLGRRGVYGSEPTAGDLGGRETALREMNQRKADQGVWLVRRLPLGMGM